MNNKKYFWLVIIAVSAIILYVLFAGNSAGPALDRSENKISTSTPMLITSPLFKDGEYIPKKFSCDGGNMNPELQIQNVPPEAKSLALIMHDPDAPRPGGFTHWVVWNIDPKTTIIKEESVPPGAVEGANGTGKPGYIGPCPPSGAHHYHFKLYALDSALSLAEGSDKSALETEISKHLVAQTELVGLYQR